MGSLETAPPVWATVLSIDHFARRVEPTFRSCTFAGARSSRGKSFVVAMSPGPPGAWLTVPVVPPLMGSAMRVTDQLRDLIALFT